ncbi:phospholipid-binding protein [Vibrio ponticus]|nr:phospholipid-binding protein [Vibrio ponticus]
MPTEKLEIPQGASNALIGFMLNANALDKATLTATYVNE